MTASDLCRQWIQHSEGCKFTAYPDNGAYSIGYGHRGPDVHEGDIWTQAQIDAAFDSDVSTAERMVTSLVVVPLTQGQFDALTDFVFNLGAGRLQSSTLLRHLNDMKDYDAARNDLYWVDGQGNPHGWIFSGNQVNPGLIARRKGEQILWDGGNTLT